jgi:hypothetical protein
MRFIPLPSHGAPLRWLRFLNKSVPQGNSSGLDAEHAKLVAETNLPLVAVENGLLNKWNLVGDAGAQVIKNY